MGEKATSLHAALIHLNILMNIWRTTPKKLRPATAPERTRWQRDSFSKAGRAAQGCGARAHRRRDWRRNLSDGKLYVREPLRLRLFDKGIIGAGCVVVREAAHGAARSFEWLKLCFAILISNSDDCLGNHTATTLLRAFRLRDDTANYMAASAGANLKRRNLCRTCRYVPRYARAEPGIARSAVWNAQREITAGEGGPRPGRLRYLTPHRAAALTGAPFGTGASVQTALRTHHSLPASGVVAKEHLPSIRSTPSRPKGCAGERCKLLTGGLESLHCAAMRCGCWMGCMRARTRARIAC
ncbi:hypothetical protein EJ06DRAFT_550529 [Trichodelitschia bisporula]|uniref:Uncharacterized protein n=1 Tax=Trichodelitschia bisporula TaxID=703511 RepID=A0A6G1HPS5_9PEZI|nr:hypothetical protein EJ06DRAFT_550529 [Trichodelitschia bisporula]